MFAYLTLLVSCEERGGVGDVNYAQGSRVEVGLRSELDQDIDANVCRRTDSDNTRSFPSPVARPRFAAWSRYLECLAITTRMHVQYSQVNIDLHSIPLVALQLLLGKAQRSVYGSRPSQGLRRSWRHLCRARICTSMPTPNDTTKHTRNLSLEASFVQYSKLKPLRNRF